MMAAGFSKTTLAELSRIKGEPDWMRARRLAAWRRYEETPFPAPNDELWRRTSLTDLKLDAASPFATNGHTLPSRFQRRVDDANAGGVLLQHNSVGAFARLADDLKKRGVIFCDLDTAIREHPALVQSHFMTQAVTCTESRYASRPANGAGGTREGGAYSRTIGDLKFVALHGAFFSGGTFLYVPRGVTVDLPLQTLTYFDAPSVAILTHTLVILEENAAVTLIENYASQETEPQRFSNSAVELILKPGARLQYFHMQEFAQNVWHFTSQTALLEQDAAVTWLNGALGSRVTKAFLDCQFLGAGANANLLGFFFGEGKQHFDQHTFQNHRVGRAASDLLYKGALKDEAYSAFRGLIRVNPNAQRSDAYQANRNLLLSDRAHADSIPELEIEADDVRCTHGVTVGPIDPEQRFYLMARGIPPVEAERLIVEGFFEPLTQKIPVESVRDDVARALRAKMERSTDERST